ncbi:hypothetical protein WJX74_006408 [Apatococcus lobatus]|uniref:F-box domain-containing protein n=1 Tax=Apatococcus lobatus TaxID=904363 RepID=A0AAW1Q9B8_9CHLO
MGLLELPADVLQQVGELFVGEVEAAGLRGVSVVAREVASLVRVCKRVQPLVGSMWAALDKQTPQILSQLGISDILDEHGYGHLLGDKPYFGPINLQNHQAPTLRKHSAGLHALGRVERLLLRKHLSSVTGPFALSSPVTIGIEQLRAPMAIKVVVAVEKCQWFWCTPSPIWRSVPERRELEPIEMVRELNFSRYDRGLEQDQELRSLLDAHVSEASWPYGTCSRNTWWGLRKLVCDRWTPADIQAKHAQRRKAAGICLYCMEDPGQRCYNFCCAICCQSRRLPCHVHERCADSSRTKKQKRRRR